MVDMDGQIGGGWVWIGKSPSTTQRRPPHNLRSLSTNTTTQIRPTTSTATHGLITMPRYAAVCAGGGWSVLLQQWLLVAVVALVVDVPLLLLIVMIGMR